MENIELNLKPFVELDWEIEDRLSGQLADEMVLATEEIAQEMFKELCFNLPSHIEPRLLEGGVAPDSDNFDFYSINVPLNILLPEGLNLVRLRLKLDLKVQTNDATKSVFAYDLFPPDKYEVKDIDLGKVSVDISKLLKYVCPPIGEGLGLNLSFPIKWKYQFLSIKTTDRYSNPVQWEIKDKAILNSFNALAIIQVSKGTNVTVDASVAGEVRKSGLLGKIIKARFISDTSTYALKKEMKSNATMPTANI